MKELVGDPNVANDQLTAEELALGNSDEEELQGKVDHVRGAELTIGDSNEAGLPLFDPHSTTPIDKNEPSSPDPTSNIKGTAPQQSVFTHLTANDPPSQAKPKTHTHPASKAIIATTLNNAPGPSQNKTNSALEREKVHTKSSAAHNACKASCAEEAAQLRQKCLAFKKSAAPSLKESKKIFNEDTTIQSQDAKILHTEDNCAFFIQLAKDLCSPWILEEIELLAQN
ncbi:hypothetical protein DFH28DRAFT_1093915 [Melampsora americana]|nr:hypothetical protein DFH28DRAFT_1093915 [Melampsora americana]